MPISNPKVIQRQAQGSANFLNGWKLGAQMVQAQKELNLRRDELEEQKRQINLQNEWNIINKQAELLEGGIAQIAGENPALLRSFFTRAGWAKPSVDRAINQLASSTIDPESLKSLMQTQAAMNGWTATQELVWDDQMLQRATRQDVMDASGDITRTTTASGAPEELTLTDNMPAGGTPDQPIGDEGAKSVAEKLAELIGTAVGTKQRIRSGLLAKIDKIRQLPQRAEEWLLGQYADTSDEDFRSSEEIIDDIMNKIDQAPREAAGRAKDAKQRAEGGDTYGRLDSEAGERERAAGMIEPEQRPLAGPDTSGSDVGEATAKIRGYKLPSGYVIPENTDLVEVTQQYANREWFKSSGSDLDKMAAATAYKLWRRDESAGLFDQASGLTTGKGDEVVEQIKAAILEQQPELFDDKGNYVDNRELVEKVGEYDNGIIRIKQPGRMTKDLLVREVAGIMGYDKDDYERVENAIMIVNDFTSPEEMQKALKKGGSVQMPLFDIRSPMLYNQSTDKGNKYANRLISLSKKLTSMEFPERAVLGAPTAPSPPSVRQPGVGTAGLEGRNLRTLFSEKTKNSYAYKTFVKTAGDYMEDANKKAADNGWRYDFSNKAEFDATLMALSGAKTQQEAYGWLTGARQRELEILAQEGQISYTEALTRQANARADEAIEKIRLLQEGDMRGSPEMAKYATEVLKQNGIILDNTLKKLEISQMANPLNPKTYTGALFYQALDAFEKEPPTRREMRLFRKNPDKLDLVRSSYLRIVEQFLVQYAPELFQSVDPDARDSAIISFVQDPNIRGGLMGGMMDLASQGQPAEGVDISQFPPAVQQALKEWNANVTTGRPSSGATREF